MQIPSYYILMERNPSSLHGNSITSTEPKEIADLCDIKYILFNLYTLYQLLIAFAGHICPKMEMRLCGVFIISGTMKRTRNNARSETI